MRHPTPKAGGRLARSRAERPQLKRDPLGGCLSTARIQLKRVKRYLTKIETRRAGDLAEDDLLAFFQNCWHLKDHILADASVPGSVKSTLEADVDAIEALRIAADLANRSKHVTLKRKDRTGAHISVYHVHAYDGSDDRPATLDYQVSLKDGSHRDALDVARQAVAAWDGLFTRYGL